MNLTFDELRDIKHKLPTGSVNRIAKELQIDEQTVRDYFGAHKFAGSDSSNHLQPGPNGGIVHIDDTRILDLALQIIKESSQK